MCGIVAILGRHEVAPLLVEALKRLEYRGYDSAGIATLQDGALVLTRDVPFGSRRLREDLRRMHGLTVDEADAVLQARSERAGEFEELLRGGAEDRFESLGLDFQKRLAKGFRAPVREFPARVRLIDGSGSADDVAARIRAALCRPIPTTFPNPTACRAPPIRATPTG